MCSSRSQRESGTKSRGLSAPTGRETGREQVYPCVCTHALGAWEQGVNTRNGESVQEVGSELLCLGFTVIQEAYMRTCGRACPVEPAFMYLMCSRGNCTWHSCTHMRDLTLATYTGPSRGTVVYACLRNRGGPWHHHSMCYEGATH